MNVEYREYRPDDSVEVCELLNRIFHQFQFSHDAWLEVTASDFTAPVAVLNGRIVGAIPLKRRVYRVAPGCEVVAWVLFRVGVASELRGQGIGSGMQRAIKGFLHDRADILLVNTCGQHTQQYRFYRRNGLYDVAGPQHFSVQPLGPVSTSPSVGFQRVSEDDFFSNRARWIELYESCYGEFGGYPLRTETFPFDHLSLLHSRTGSARTAYATLGPPNQPAGYAFFVEDGSATHVLEFAVRDGDPAHTTQLLDALRSLGQPVSLPASQGTALWHLLHETPLSSAVQVERTRPVIVHVLNIESTARRVWTGASGLGNISVKVRTHAREATLHGSADPTREISLDLQEHTLSRLLMRRIDVGQAVREERIAAKGADRADIDALTEAFRPCPWVYHGVDGL